MPPGKRISPKEALAALCGISLILGVMALIANAQSIEELIEGYVFLRIRGLLKLQWLSEIPNEIIAILVIAVGVAMSLLKK